MIAKWQSYDSSSYRLVSEVTENQINWWYNYNMTQITGIKVRIQRHQQEVLITRAGCCIFDKLLMGCYSHLWRSFLTILVIKVLNKKTSPPQISPLPQPLLTLQTLIAVAPPPGCSPTLQNVVSMKWNTGSASADSQLINMHSVHSLYMCI